MFARKMIYSFAGWPWLQAGGSDAHLSFFVHLPHLGPSGGTSRPAGETVNHFSGEHQLLQYSATSSALTALIAWLLLFFFIVPTSDHWKVMGSNFRTVFWLIPRSIRSFRWVPPLDIGTITTTYITGIEVDIHHLWQWPHYSETQLSDRKVNVAKTQPGSMWSLRAKEARWRQ